MPARIRAAAQGADDSGASDADADVDAEVVETRGHKGGGAMFLESDLGVPMDGAAVGDDAVVHRAGFVEEVRSGSGVHAGTVPPVVSSLVTRTNGYRKVPSICAHATIAVCHLQAPAMPPQARLPNDGS